MKTSAVVLLPSVLLTSLSLSHAVLCSAEVSAPATSVSPPTTETTPAKPAPAKPAATPHITPADQWFRDLLQQTDTMTIRSDIANTEWVKGAPPSSPIKGLDLEHHLEITNPTAMKALLSSFEGTEPFERHSFDGLGPMLPGPLVGVVIITFYKGKMKECIMLTNAEQVKDKHWKFDHPIWLNRYDYDSKEDASGHYYMTANSNHQSYLQLMQTFQSLVNKARHKEKGYQLVLEDWAKPSSAHSPSAHSGSAQSPAKHPPKAAPPRQLPSRNKALAR